MTTRHPSATALASLAVLLLASALPAAAKSPKAKKTVEPKADSIVIAGRILTADGKPVHGAVLSAIHLESSKVTLADPTPTSGAFRVAGIPYGYYQLAVTDGETLHAAAVPVNVGPRSSLKLDIVLLSAKPVSEGEEATVIVPVLGRPASASAEVRGLDHKSFFKTKAGAATLIGGSAAMLLLATR